MVGECGSGVKGPFLLLAPEARCVSQGEDGGGGSEANQEKTGKVLEIGPVKTVEGVGGQARSWVPLEPGPGYGR